MSRPPQRFVIRRISTGAKTNLPWTLTDRERPSYVGRHPTMTAALAEVDQCRPPLRWMLGAHPIPPVPMPMWCGPVPHWHPPLPEERP